MANWRDQVLKEFTPKVARLTLVADPDGLLLEEGVVHGIREKGFELIPFEDHVAFRYIYESKFRSNWDSGEQTNLVVVLRSGADDLASLPYDLLQAGRQLSFNLGEIFPNLSYPIVSVLDRADLDKLFEAQNLHAPGVLGDNATKEFILRHVFEIAPELIRKPSDLLRVFLRRHYREQRIPKYCETRLVQLLVQDGAFESWPIEMIVSDREVFFDFLQERWPIFLDSQATTESSSMKKNEKFYELTVDGPIDLPFDHQDIQGYIDNLFIEGHLKPVSHEHAQQLSKTWISTGIKIDPSADRIRRIGKLIENLLDSIPAENARHDEWFRFAHGWAELILLTNEQPSDMPEKESEGLKKLLTKVDSCFSEWVLKRYAGHVNLPPVPPVMLHHLPQLLSREIGEDSDAKVAMIVVDGMSLDQWLVVRESLNSQQSGFRFREQSVFAWVPTLTSVSRQTLFAGKPPYLFPDSIQTTRKEPALWTQFWTDTGLTPAEVVYVKGLGDDGHDKLIEALSHPKVRIAGLVVDKIDKIMHGMEMGSAGMHNQVRQWSQQPYLRELLDLLLDRGFRVFLTSDHGNIDARGCGRPAEGAVADLRGERVRIYSDSVLRDQVKDRFPSAVEWPSVGLPENWLVLLAPSRQAFVNGKVRTVSHGGISIEELIVPLVQIERSDP